MRRGGGARGALPAPRSLPLPEPPARPGRALSEPGEQRGRQGAAAAPGKRVRSGGEGGVSAQGPAGGARGVRDGSGVEVGAAGSWWPAPGHGESGCEAGGFGAAFG